ncbi:MAG: GntR family transcriptional regulator [Microbacterium sp.]|uniref:GntR family transcriptional regulator n=1 Tax=Microbacterium sp. TaxID=51671 RepID=UPI001D3DA7AA|nr:GntR family transcriptional regulator [Microbacterium sp.]MBW8762508.1 GntR family transcriptional regulator [Microbacterium sp.]
MSATAPDPRVRPVRISPRLIVDDVHDQLVRLIMDGHMQPEQSLSIDALAREFGVSTSPVREALARLDSTGLVQRVALRGYRVAPAPDSGEIGELIDARLLLEPATAAEAARLESRSALVQRLDDTLVRLSGAPSGEQFDSFRSYYDADREFHRSIFTGVGNRFILQAYDALGGHVQRFRLFSGKGVTDAEETVAEHSAIRDAISDGDPALAERAMRSHLVGVRHRSLEDLESV